MRLLEQFPPKADPPLAGASASALGAEGRGFESHQPDHQKHFEKSRCFCFCYLLELTKPLFLFYLDTSH